MKYFPLLFVLLLSSCVEKHEEEIKPTLLSHFIKITENENKGVDEILSYYNGVCQYSIGFEGKRKYFELEMSKVRYFEVFSHRHRTTANNIAYLFYKNLKSEKSKYDKIRVIMRLKNGKTKHFNVATSQLKTVHRQMKLVNQLVSRLQKREFDKINPMLSNERFTDYTKEEWLTRIEKIEDHFGDIKELMTSGFDFIASEYNTILRIDGSLLRSKQASQFQVEFDIQNHPDKILFFNYLKK